MLRVATIYLRVAWRILKIMFLRPPQAPALPLLALAQTQGDVEDDGVSDVISGG